jgi:solute carrier family 50 protein (sugar transporter)
VLGFGLGLLQIVVYAIYRNRGEKDITKAPIEPLKSIVIETQLADKNEQEKKSKDDKSEEEPIACGV